MAERLDPDSSMPLFERMSRTLRATGGYGCVVPPES